MRKTNYPILLLLVTFIVAFSCKNKESKKNKFLPTVKGKAGEVVVVINKDMWNGEIGLSLKETLMKAISGLPQPEPLFNTVNIEHSAFGALFKTHRNLVITKVESSVKEAKFIVQENVWAKPQIVINLIAPDYFSLNKLILENKNKIVLLLRDAERKRLIANYKKYEEKKVREHLEKTYHISLAVPLGYQISVEADNFIWIAHETTKISQGIFVYWYDYTDTNTFTTDYLVKKRDIFLKKHVPGPSPDSYMSTEKEFFPQMSEFMLNGEKYIAELRGLWKVENDFMGGPFLSYTTLDEKRNRIITIEGFVYAPQFNKRNYLRQVEAILHTLKISE